jgi:transcription elongation GreA/GreB family factor
MSKAFTKEDVDPPERSGRVRSASGLPPGAVNYITRRGAKRLRAELDELRRINFESARIAELEEMLASASVVDPPDSVDKSVAFGAVVTVNDGAIKHTYRIVGVDEVDFEADAVTWISPIGRTLLAAELGERVTLPGVSFGPARIVGIEYDRD